MVDTSSLPIRNGLQSINTLGSMGHRSIPRSQRALYLDLFVLQNQRDRLLKERAVLQAKKTQIGRRLSFINKNMKHFLALTIGGAAADGNKAFSEKIHKKSTILEY